MEQKSQQAQEAIRRLGPDVSQVTVGQVMTAAPRCVRPDLSIYELVKLFHAVQFRHLLVADESGRLAGVISDRDVLRCFGPAGAPPKEVLAAITVGQLMSTDMIAVGPAMLVSDAISLLIDTGIHCLPVVNDGLLVGILTGTDLHLVLRALLESPGVPVVVPTHSLPAVAAPSLA